MKIGDIVWKPIEFGMAGGQNVPPQKGRIVYIHPERWFFTVEFTYPWNGAERRFRESYPLKNRITAPNSANPPETHPGGAVAQARKPAHPGGYLLPAKPVRRKK